MAIDKNSPVGKGIRTTVQTVIGLVVGLFLVVWAVPGVPAAVAAYVTANALPLLVATGIPAGLVSWLWNLAEERWFTNKTL